MAGTSRDTKALVLAALAAALPGVQVVSSVPYANGDPPDPLVLVIATGGQGQHQRVLSTGQVTIDSFAPTTGQAMRLALRVDAAINALVAGHDWPVTKVTGNAPSESDDDSLYLGPYDAALATKIQGLTTAVPTALKDCGWISDDGIKLTMDDSVTKIKGHQGHGVVRTFMDSSETGLEAALLESQLDIVTRFLNAKAEKIQEQIGAGPQKTDVAKLTAKAQRTVTVLSGVLDVFDTASTGDARTRMRIVFPRLELGERGEVAFKVGELTAWSYKLSVLGDYVIYSNAKSLIPA